MTGLAKRCQLVEQVPLLPRRGLFVQRPRVRRTGESVRGHAHCRHSCDAAPDNRRSARLGMSGVLTLGSAEAILYRCAWCLPAGAVRGARSRTGHPPPGCCQAVRPVAEAPAERSPLAPLRAGSVQLRAPHLNGFVAARWATAGCATAQTTRSLLTNYARAARPPAPWRCGRRPAQTAQARIAHEPVDTSRLCACPSARVCAQAHHGGIADRHGQPQPHAQARADRLQIRQQSPG